MLTTPLILTFALYLVAILAVGIIAYKATHSLKDYVLGGRKMGPAVTAISASASDMSGWLLMGLPGAVFLTGLNQTWIAIGLFIGAFANWHYIAPKIRHFTFFYGDSITIPQFLEKRFNTDSSILRITSSVIILIFFTLYVASGFVAGATLFQELLGIRYDFALLIGAVGILLYTFFGGFFAVSWTDLFQGIMMLLALVCLPLIALFLINDSNNQAGLKEVDPSFFNFFHDLGFLSIISLLAWGLGYFGQPHIIARFMAAKDIKTITKAKWISVSWMGISLLGAVLVGFVSIFWFKEGEVTNPETVFIYLSQAILSPWLGGILLAAILSAIMSTIDSQLLVSASVLTNDLYKGKIKPNATQKELVWIGRLTVFVIALVAIIMAKNQSSNILDLVSYAWAGFGATFGPVLILSLFWDKYSAKGAVATLITGAIVVILYKQLSGSIFDIYELVPGFIAALIAGYFGSKKMPDPKDKKVHQLYKNAINFKE